MHPIIDIGTWEGSAGEWPLGLSFLSFRVNLPPPYSDENKAWCGEWK